MTYAVLIPLKQTSRGKSRLRLPAGRRAALAMAMMRDTLAAVVSVDTVDLVLVVAEDAADAAALAGDRVETMVTAVRGLNEAIADGARELRARGWSGPVAVLPGDLPFLTGTDLARALTEAARALTEAAGALTEAAGAAGAAAVGAAAVVADAEGTGTTLLVAAGPAALQPRFGVGSFRRHQEGGARPIPVAAGSSLHLDVDVIGDLHLPGDLELLGTHTREVLRAASGEISGGAAEWSAAPSTGGSSQVTVLP